MYRVISDSDSRPIVIYYTLSRVNEQLRYRSIHSDLLPLDVLNNGEALSHRRAEDTLTL